MSLQNQTKSALRIHQESQFPFSLFVYHLHVKFLAVNFAEVGTRLNFFKVGVSPMPFTLPSWFVAITVVVKMLRNRPWCNIKAQQENLLLKRQLWDWLECAVIDRRWVCFKRDTQAFTARLRFQISQRKCFEMCRDTRRYYCLFNFRRLPARSPFSKSLHRPTRGEKCRGERVILIIWWKSSDYIQTWAEHKTISASLTSFVWLEMLPEEKSHSCPARVIERLAIEWLV